MTTDELRADLKQIARRAQATHPHVASVLYALISAMLSEQTASMVAYLRPWLQMHHAWLDALVNSDTHQKDHNG